MWSLLQTKGKVQLKGQEKKKEIQQSWSVTNESIQVILSLNKFESLKHSK